jgi:hypothetical protein
MWNKIVEWCRPHMTIWCMRIAYWIPTATKTHTRCIILIAFPQQQWLHEPTSISHYTYIACLFLYDLGVNVDNTQTLWWMTAAQVKYAPDTENKPCHKAKLFQFSLKHIVTFVSFSFVVQCQCLHQLHFVWLKMNYSGWTGQTFAFGKFSIERIPLHIALFHHWPKYNICFKQFMPSVIWCT